MATANNVWVFYRGEINREIVAVKRCKRPQSTKVWKSLQGNGFYGYSLLENIPDGAQLLSHLFGDWTYHKFLSVNGISYLHVWTGYAWVMDNSPVKQYVKLP